MSTSVRELAADRCWFDPDTLWVRLRNGMTLGVPLTRFPRLYYASAEEREAFEFSGEGTGIHWPALDEDISVAGLLAGRGDETRWGLAERAKLGSLDD
jgi:hypothetical protein